MLLWSGVWGLLCLVVGWSVAQRKMHQEAYTYVCEMVADRSLFTEVSISKWRQECLSGKSDLGWLSPPEAVLSKLQEHLNKVGVSHLAVYGPVQDKRLWKGLARETGIRTWTVDGRFVVSEVIQDSAAERAGIRPGDVVHVAGGRPVLDTWQVQSATGPYILERDGKNFEVILQPTEISIDRRPMLTSLTDEVGHLRISSYRSEYFEKESWKNMAGEMMSYPKLVVDLRGNRGGNFVAMLRSLSPFICETRDLGRWIQPRRTDETRSAFQDDIADLYQIRHMEAHREVPVHVFRDYGCYKGRVVVLVNRETSSVAEIFASALREGRGALVLGQKTAGDVVLAIWYGIPYLGQKYSLSIPEAIYENAEGTILEGHGLQPDENLFYILEEAIQGRDSWLLRAIERLRS